MKKTLLNGKKDFQEIKERLYNHFASIDESRHEKFSSLEEALEKGYYASFDSEMNKEEKHKLLYKSIYTVMYECNQLKKVMDIKQMIMYRNIVCGISLVKKENETWLYSILDISMKLLISFMRSNDDEQFFYFFQDTNYYLVDFLSDPRITTISDREREMINDFYKFGEYKLMPELKDIAQSSRLEIIIEYYVSVGAYWYINNQLNEIEKRRSYITASCLSISNENYYSIRLAAIISIKALLSNNKSENNQELKDKLIELGGK